MRTMALGAYSFVDDVKRNFVELFAFVGQVLIIERRFGNTLTGQTSWVQNVKSVVVMKYFLCRFERLSVTSSTSQNRA